MATPYSVIRRYETGSTQDDAREAYAGRPVIVIADRQVSGRGRSGVGWLTAPRAVAASVAFEPAWEPGRWSVIPLVAGWAVREAVDHRVRLKWPNDVLLRGEKAGGVLVEAALGVVVAGCGLNLWWPDPPDGMIGLHDTDPGPDAVEPAGLAWAERLLDATSPTSAGWDLDLYRQVCDTIGRRVAWEPDGTGLATGVAPDGGLQVETAAGMIVLRSGAVRHVRPAGGD
jgi:BirA family transcriptional regulator, biotin operon repressor / biotin---[acetyl-CoA-carboxylase] ligase